MGVTGPGHRDPLPAWARVLAVLWVPRPAREEWLGDLGEAYAGRARGDARAARRWLAGQIVASWGPWLLYRIPRSGAVRWATPIVAGLATVALVLQVMNTPVMLDGVRSLPSALRLPLAWTLNAAALVCGGAVAGSVSGVGARRLVVALVLAEVSAVTALAVGTGAAPLPALDPAWIALTTASWAAGVWLVRRRAARAMA